MQGTFHKGAGLGASFISCFSWAFRQMAEKAKHFMQQLKVLPKSFVKCMSRLRCFMQGQDSKHYVRNLGDFVSVPLLRDLMCSRQLHEWACIDSAAAGWLGILSFTIQRF